MSWQTNTILIFIILQTLLVGWGYLKVEAYLTVADIMMGKLHSYGNLLFSNRDNFCNSIYNEGLNITNAIQT